MLPSHLLPIRLKRKVFIACRKQSQWYATDVNANVFLTYNEATSLAGIAYMGSVCSEDPAYRTSVSLWLESDLNTAEVKKTSFGPLTVVPGQWSIRLQ